MECHRKSAATSVRGVAGSHLSQSQSHSRYRHVLVSIQRVRVPGDSMQQQQQQQQQSTMSGTGGTKTMGFVQTLRSPAAVLISRVDVTLSRLDKRCNNYRREGRVVVSQMLATQRKATPDVSYLKSTDMG